MQSLLECFEINELNTLNKSLQLLEAELSQTQQRYMNRNRDSGVTKYSPEQEADLEQKLGAAVTRLEAARKGIDILKKVKSGQAKMKGVGPFQIKNHMARIGKNLQLIVNTIQDVYHKLGVDVNANDYLMQEGVMIAKPNNKRHKASNIGAKAAVVDKDDDSNPFDGTARKLVKKVKKVFKK